MQPTAERYLWIARHGEATPDEEELSERGRQQADLLGRRLRDVPLSAVHHGPLPRAAETARRVARHLPDVPVHLSEAAGDYLPYLPQRADLPAECAEQVLEWVADFSAAERESGPPLAREALRRFTGTASGDEPRHELLITHNFLIGWLIRAALDAPRWRWFGLNHAHAALTVIRYRPGRPATLVVQNDLRHLPADLCWTGFPPGHRV
ncbi:histidine phosphatase family protein [Streptomyces sp. 549]|uniref:histidine phosphatase family protein n=1 Tax=Streptomyces sp. 549 TaxID=3049076 RepID=UPI0024C26E5B|nr:histidine phosphatase family protein [Streptomyces sp. 549]MDK1474599.1 histidine phosphatase family protein [Streptomyces sp. 549]